jgi:hypothetical protein
MNSFFILKDPTRFDHLLPDLPPDNTLVVHVDVWEVQTKYQSVKWSVFKQSFVSYEQENLIIVGMNRIRTDASRYDLVYSHIYKLKNYQYKAIIDDRPFYGEPWRLWYIYGFLFHTWIAGENSFALQVDWNHWFERNRPDCLIAPDNLRKHITNTFSDAELLTTRFQFRQPDIFENQKYHDVKAEAFRKYDTHKNIIQFMLKNLPIGITYESYLSNQTFTMPDWPISRFMVEENERRMNIYNTVINAGNGSLER